MDGQAGMNWECPYCDHVLQVPPAPQDQLTTCAICGNHEFYKKKDFPHWLGLTILAGACLGFIVCNALYWQWLAWMVLIGSAAFDGLFYLAVADALVCYRCGAHYRGLPAGSMHKPFELGVAERYRQERSRREQLQEEKE
jgi:hypothetical protein